MTSSIETGGAADIHIILRGDNKSLIKIKKKCLNRQNLEIKCQRHFNTDSKCYLLRTHQHTKDINVPEELKIFTVS